MGLTSLQMHDVSGSAENALPVDIEIELAAVHKEGLIAVDMVVGHLPGGLHILGHRMHDGVQAPIQAVGAFRVRHQTGFGENLPVGPVVLRAAPPAYFRVLQVKYKFVLFHGIPSFP